MARSKSKLTEVTKRRLYLEDALQDHLDQEGLGDDVTVVVEVYLDSEHPSREALTGDIDSILLEIDDGPFAGNHGRQAIESVYAYMRNHGYQPDADSSTIEIQEAQKGAFLMTSDMLFTLISE